MKQGSRIVWLVVALVLLMGTAAPTMASGSLRLTWTNAATDITGHYVERTLMAGSPLACGTFARVATIGNVLTYQDTDPALLQGGSYCYRVQAFNTVAVSDYSNVASGVIPFPAPVLVTVTVAILQLGPGAGGAVTMPNGTLCMSGTCAAAVAVGETITLAALAKPNGSRFAGWAGGGCGASALCTVTVAEAVTLSAAFARK